MVIRSASLALVLVIGGSVFAGIPLHSNEQIYSINLLRDSYSKFISQMSASVVIREK